MTRSTLIVAALVLVLANGAGAGQAQEPKLFGEVGPGFMISFKDATGNRVTHLDPGAYEIQVNDLGEEHNFHLQGPGVDFMTDVSTTGQTTWQVTFQDGNYMFFCDPHSSIMRGTFTVGTPPPPPPTPTPTTVTPSAPVGAKLLLTAGPAASITLKTVGGKAVKILKAGGYTVVARDRSTSHDAHLLGAGVNRSTTVPFVGTKTWKLVLKTGTLVFRCDVHRTSMRGSVRIL
jgi:plastocyanin